MAKWADYLISAIQFTNRTAPLYFHVMLHADNGNTVCSGTKKTKDEIILLLDNGYKIKTTRWNYVSANWSEGAQVLTEARQNRRYLRTRPDASTADNLDNMLQMSSFGL